MAESEVDDLILEIQKSGLDDQFLVLAADTLKASERIRDIKKKLDVGAYKSKDIEELYRLELMALDLRTSHNTMEMNKLLGPHSDVLKVIKLQTK
jgi:hypothetical protein